MTLHCKDGTREFTVGEVAEWQAAYPELDLADEFRRLEWWMGLKDQNRCTVKGATRRVNHWLRKSASKPRSPKQSTQASPFLFDQPETPEGPQTDQRRREAKQARASSWKWQMERQRQIAEDLYDRGEISKAARDARLEAIENGKNGQASNR